MPTITPSDALIKAADNLVDAISDQPPKNSITVDAIEQLMEMHKIQVKKATCKAQAQRVLREQAQAQRVSDEQQTSTQTTLTSFSAIEVEASYNQTPVRIG
jgi:hypothetical protein